jgi:hypothetical protein
MKTEQIRDWFSDRLRSADLLIMEVGTGATSDAEILLCSAMSALAARGWPGRHMDRVRFVEFLIRFAPSEHGISAISTPILAARLRLAGDLPGALKLKEAFFPGSELLIVTGSDVDKDEKDIQAVLPALDLKTVRGHSYAALIYTDLRSHLVHEYSISTLLSSFSHSDGGSLPDYTNMTLDPTPQQVEDLTDELGATEAAIRSWTSAPIRQLHFPFSYLRNVISSAAEGAFTAWHGQTQWELPRPTTWWVEGG